MILSRLHSLLKRHFKKVVILLVCLLVGFFGVRHFTKAADQAILTTKVSREDLKETLVLSGEVSAEQQVVLRFQTSGYLSWVGVKEGDPVKKWQALASLDRRGVEMQLKKDLNDYLSERWDLDQTREDNRDNVYTDSVKRLIDQAQFGVNNSVLDVQIQDLALQFSSLWSPIDGIVTKMAAPFAGVNVTPSQSEIQVVNPATLYFSALVDQTELTSLAASMAGELTLDAFPNEVVRGNIYAIAFSPKAGESDTVYEVKFSLPQSGAAQHYRLGMTGDLSFEIASKTGVLVVPPKFIKSEKGKKYLLVLRGDQKTKVFVELGMETDEATEVTGGIFEGDTIYEN